VVDVILVLCPDPYGGGGVIVIVGVEVGVTIGVAVLTVLLGVAIPTSSSPSTAPKRSAISKFSASMEVRSRGTELPPPTSLGRGGLDAMPTVGSQGGLEEMGIGEDRGGDGRRLSGGGD
jgi:hypothetical protein